VFLAAAALLRIPELDLVVAGVGGWIRRRRA
jgi:hypothetical protein